MSEAPSTFERMMQNKAFKKDFEAGYERFLLTEKICEAMEEMNLSVRQLAEKAHVSKTTIMKLRTGDSERISVRTLTSVLSVLHYRLAIEKSSL